MSAPPPVLPGAPVPDAVRDGLWRFVLAASLLGYPLLGTLADFTVGYETSQSVLLRGAIAAAALAAIARSWFKGDVEGGWPVALLLGFGAAYLARIAWATLVVHEPLWQPPRNYWLWSCGACLLPALALALAPKSRALISSLALPMWGMAFVAMAGVIQLGLVVQSELALEGIERQRLSTQWLDPISFGVLAASLVILSFGLPQNALARRRLPRPLLLAMALAGLALGLYGLVLANSRGPFVALGAVGLAMAVGGTGRTRLVIGLLLIVLAATAVPLLDEVERIANIDALDRLRGDRLFHDYARVVRHRVAWRVFEQSPLVGGALGIRTLGYPHNVFLEALMATGVAAAALFALCVAALWKSLQRLRDPDLGWLAALTIFAIVGAQFSGALYNVIAFWILPVTLLTADARLRRDEAAADRPQAATLPAPRGAG